MFARAILGAAVLVLFAAHARAEKLPVLFVVTATDHLTLKDGSKHPTGYYANELAEPYQEISRAGFRVELATPGGRRPTCDPRSLDAGQFAGGAKEAAALRRELDSIPGLSKPVDLAAVKIERYAGVFVPGGHGPMEDLAASPEMGRLLRAALAAGKPVGLLCHGPGALLAAGEASGAWPFKGYHLTAFSDAEEPPDLAGKMRQTPEAALKSLGALYSKAPGKYQPHVVSDRGLVTGQNPASARATATAFLHALGAFHINGPNVPARVR